MDVDKLFSGLRQRVPVQDILAPSIIKEILSQASQGAAPPEGFLFSIASQEKILQVVRADVLTHNAYYAKLFLKRFIEAVEKSGHEVSEELYELYCDPAVLSSTELGPTDSDVLSYTISRDVEIFVKEYPKLISGQGTTGMRTWEAALYLASYLTQQPESGGAATAAAAAAANYNFDGKSVLELGTGTGLVSLALAKNRKIAPSKLILTDGDTQLIDNLNGTFQLNEIPRDTVRCQQLLWGTTDPANAEDYIQSVPPAVDYVIAADVTYDSRVLALLCSTISDFFAHSGTKAALIAATVRNEDTLANWEEELDKWFGRSSWRVRERCEKPETLAVHAWFRKGTPEIRIYEILSPQGEE